MILLIILLQFQLVVINDNFFSNFAHENQKYVKSLIRKSIKQKCVEKNTLIEPFFIFTLGTTHSLKKLHFNSPDVLFKHLVILKDSENIPRNYVYFYNMENKILFEIDNSNILYCLSHLNSEKILNYSKKRSINYIFNIMGSNVSIYFAVVNDQLRVLDLRTGDLKEFNAFNFVNENWNDLFPLD